MLGKKTLLLLVALHVTCLAALPNPCAVVPGLPGTPSQIGVPGTDGVKGDLGLPGLQSPPEVNQGPLGSDVLPGPIDAPGIKGPIGKMADIGLPGTPALLDKLLLFRLSQIDRRVSRLEGVLMMEGKIKAVGKKIFATNGKEVDFEVSKNTCKAAGGKLATPTNDAENKAILSIVKEHNRYAYLGIREGAIPGVLQNLDGLPVTYTRWRKNEPNGKGKENCVEMYTDGTWNDKACNQNRLTICEF
ncbi:pulmonary surfactant-associated protein A-like [Spea bombifrons]|uniref:pulmonary surfactant-associated protein A-like n=1 Tax=Spea bombifrons TaxID=233779 RepID=UPI00234A3A5D|nr:pulmonary surfactant-associated protein A-like [Spea bombifrons]